jgi:MGT family glycosyltransferase
MSRVLVVNGNLYGHVNPTLPLVRELVERGEEVWYFCSEIFAERIIATGAHFIGSGEMLEQFYKTYKPTGNHPFYSIIEYIIKTDQVMIPVVLEKTKGLKFDYIIHDSILGGGKFLGETMNLPTICSSSSFAMNKLPIPPRMLEKGFHPQLDEFYKVLEQVCQACGTYIPSVLDVFFKKGDMNIVYTSKEFHPDAASFDESFKFVGPSIEAREEIVDFPFETINSKKMIYISLGTINTEFVDFYKKCIEALGDTDMKVVLSIGKNTNISSFERVPENFILKNYVPQLEILKRASLFISHGGLNSVNEALYYGVPIIAIPMVNDQHMVTRQLIETGAGFGLKMGEITVEVIKDSVYKMLSDSNFMTSSNKMGEAFRAAGGYKAAVDYIFDFKKKNKI